MTNQKQNNFFNFKDTDINLSLDDLLHLLEQKGVGFIYNSEVFEIKNFDSLILKRFQKYLASSKVVLIEFTINQNEPLSSIEKCMDILYDTIDEDTEVVLGTQSVEYLSDGYCEITLIFSGINECVLNFI